MKEFYEETILLNICSAKDVYEYFLHAYEINNFYYGKHYSIGEMSRIENDIITTVESKHYNCKNCYFEKKGNCRRVKFCRHNIVFTGNYIKFKKWFPADEKLKKYSKTYAQFLEYIETFDKDLEKNFSPENLRFISKDKSISNSICYDPDVILRTYLVSFLEKNNIDVKYLHEKFSSKKRSIFLKEIEKHFKQLEI